MKDLSHIIARLRNVASTVRSYGTIAGLPEFDQIIPSDRVQAYFKQEPKQRQFLVDRVNHRFQTEVTALETDRARFDGEVKRLRVEHQLLAGEGREQDARNLHQEIERQTNAFQERYDRVHNLAKGTALVLANRALEDLDRTLASGEHRIREQEEARLRNMSTEELLREIVRKMK